MSNNPSSTPAQGPPSGRQGNKFILVRHALRTLDLSDGDPCAYVRHMRNLGWSLGDIAIELTTAIRNVYGDARLSISHETVRRWDQGIVPASELAENSTTGVTAVEPRHDEHGVPQATFQAASEAGDADA